MSRWIALATFIVVALPLDAAHAHVCMDAPISRVGDRCTAASPQKVGPCGVNGRGANVTTVRPGETITLMLNETIDHPSHYRVAFNPNGDSFEDPTSKDDKDGKHPFVLLDGILDEAAARQSIEVTLPDITCDRCTLQLIQVMYDKGSNGFGGNDGVAPDNDDLYYACADLVLAEDAPIAPARDAGAEGGGSRDAGRTGETSPDGAPGGGDPDAGAHGAHDGRDESDEAPLAEDGCSVRPGAGQAAGALTAPALLGAALVLRRRRRG